MVDETLKPALRAALRCNEIGDETPYQLDFAGKGNSGASFGFMQGDISIAGSRSSRDMSPLIRSAHPTRAR